MKRALAIVAAVAVLGMGAAALAQQKLPERWNYVRADLGSDGGQDKFLELMKQSKDVGCTHLMLVEGRWFRAPDDAKYQARVDKIQAAAKEMGLTIVPCVYAIGYSGRYLGSDHNLAAGLPVKDMAFVVKGKTAQADPADALDAAALKSTGTGMSGTLKCKPFYHYRVTFEVAGGLTGESDEQIQVTTSKGKRSNARRNPDTRKAGDKTLVETTFNSLEGDELNFRVGAKGEITNLKIVPAGALMIVRRELTPLKVTSADGKTVYKEGEDFKPVSDPKLTSGGEYEFNHESPAIELTDNSKIQDGQKLLVSFFHAYRMGGDQDGISMEDPAVFKIMDQDMKNAAKVWKAAGYFMNYDEIRIGGWETPDKKPGEILAAHVKKGYDMVKQYAPAAKVYTWSDMFCPGHNARPFSVKGYYYLVNGNWDGAWEGLPKDVIIMNWYSPDTKNMKFFADRGQPQVLCGYYDAKDTAGLKKNIAGWMKVSEGVPNVLGFMYTTWRRNFTHLKEYFQLVDTYAEWGKGTATGERVKEPGVEH